MKTLIVEDDFTSRLLMQELLKAYGPSHIAINGREAVNAARVAREAGEAYDLICLDIMMPELDGQAALREIRADEESRGIQSCNGSKIVMTTALSDYGSIDAAYYGLCDAYLTKPIDKGKLKATLAELGLQK